MQYAALLVVSLLVAMSFAPGACAHQPVTLTASDGVKISGTYYAAPSASAPIILLFHQAGSNRWEYAPIAPRLVSAGFSALAIDARHGGEMWGHENETVTRLGKEAGYLEALADLEAALEWARKQNPSRKVIVWGSSYSSCLVFVLAGKHPSEIAGLLSFSPAEYFQNKTLVHDAAEKVNIPVFITSAKGPEEEDAARSIYDAVADKKDRAMFVPKAGGVHGSSTLRADRNPEGAEEYWSAVLGFLKQF
ncbi:MAG: alpha/beta fold hydrolase [Candidatus Acidiferrales bacterium]